MLWHAPAMPAYLSDDGQTFTQWQQLTLTTSSVLYMSYKGPGNSVSSCLLLTHVSGTRVQRSDAPEFLVAAVILGIVTTIAFGVLHPPELYLVGVVGVLLVGVCVGCFVTSRRVVLTIFAGERQLRSAVKASNVKVAREALVFANHVERLAVLAQHMPRRGLAEPELGPADAPLLAPLQ